MTDRHPNGEAQMLLDSALLAKIYDDQERAAFERAVYADPGDDLKRLTCMLRVQEIRSLRAELITLAKGSTKPADDGAVA